MTAPDEKKPTKFGWFFMQKMEDAGLTQSELSRLTRLDGNTVAQATISRWIFGTGRPQPEGLRAVARHIKVHPDILMKHAGYGFTETPEVVEAPGLLEPVAERLSRLLAEDGGLSEQERRDLERLTTGLVVQYETIASQQRKRSENRVG